MKQPTPADQRRRSFMFWSASTGVAATLLPGVLWAESKGASVEITVEMIDHAARLAGLEFTLTEREQMLASLQKNLVDIEALRTIDIDQNVPPPLYFNPVVPGQRFDTPNRPFVLGPRSPVKRPGRLEDLAFWPITELAKLIETRQVSASELTEMYLERITRLDKQINAVVTVTEARARRQAAAMDAELAEGHYRGPLHGIPWGAKDLIAVRDYPTTWGFRPYENQLIDYDATVTERLDAAGAVLVAKLATGEIARGDFWLGRQTRNPWKTDEGADGSSAGPAAAVAAGLVAFAIGTDTTGSILGPSRTCGITGLRPTFGRVSRHGVMPVCWSLDKVGPMCRTAEDCAIVLKAIAGPDDRDLAVADKAFNYHGGRDVSGLRVGWLQAAFERDDDASLANDRSTLAALGEFGLTMLPVALPQHADMDPLPMLLVDESAAFAELMRSGDLRYFRQDIDEPEDMLMRVAHLHTAVDYIQAQRRRMLLMQGMATLFESIDVLVVPFSGSPQQNATSLTGHPSVAVQNGFDAEGRPTGIQFIGQLYGEAEALTVARHYQMKAPWYRQHPDGFI